MGRLCAECEEVRAAHRDPRSPPVEAGDDALCGQCFWAAAEDRIEELQSEIDDLKREQNETQ